MSGNLCAVKVGSHLFHHKVETIDVDNKMVVLTRQGQLRLPLVLTLTTRDPIELPELNEQEVNFMLSREGIKLRNADHGIPTHSLVKWDQVSREAQAEILVGYLKKGFVVGGYIRGDVGRAESYSSKLFEEEISRRNMVRRDAFLASLTSEQRARFNWLQRAIRFDAPMEEKEKYMAESRAAQASRDEVVANLTPEQRALYDEWMSWMERPKPAMDL